MPIRNDEQLAVQQKQLKLVDEIIDSWRSKLLPHNPKNFAIYAEGALDEAEKLRKEIDEYLASRSASGTPSQVTGNESTVDRPPASV